MNHELQTHPIDSTALLHLAVHSKNHSNVFRLEVRLKSPVRPGQLQQAANAVAARFPMLTADKGLEKLFAANLLRQGVVPTAEETPD